MICEYKDGLKVDYSGSLRITKGQDINVFVKEGFMPANLRGDFEKAVQSHSCEDLWKAAQAVRDTIGDRGCIHE